MRWVYQGIFTELCGQACVAMVANEKLDNVVNIFCKVSATRPTDVLQALVYYGIKIGSEHLNKYTKGIKLPKLALVLVKFRGKKVGHWVIYNRGKIYDPSLGVYPIEQLPDKIGGEIKGYVKLVRP